MAFNGAGAGGKSLALPNTAGAAQKPDPLLQPALANAMRLGKTFAAMSPAGSRAGIGAQPQPQTQPGQGPQVQPF